MNRTYSGGQFHQPYLAQAKIGGNIESKLTAPKIDQSRDFQLQNANKPKDEDGIMYLSNTTFGAKNDDNLSTLSRLRSSQNLKS